MGQIVLNDGRLNIGEEKVSMFIDELNLNQPTELLSNVKVTKEFKDGTYIITMESKGLDNKVEVRNVLHVDKKSNAPVKLELLDKTHGFEIVETINWENINDVGALVIPDDTQLINED